MALSEDGRHFIKRKWNYECWDGDCVVEAARTDRIPVYALPNQLTLDIDGTEAWYTFCNRWNEFVEMIGYAPEYIVMQSKSVGHKHVIITFPEGVTFTPHERMAYQTVLGSDLVRETLTLWRGMAGVTHPCRLFRPKEELEQWREQVVGISVGLSEEEVDNGIGF